MTAAPKQIVKTWRESIEKDFHNSAKDMFTFLGPEFLK